MQEQLKKRLQELKAEQSAGQKLLTDLEARYSHTQSTLLRIQGAIQILEEELTKAAQHEAVAPDFATEHQQPEQQFGHNLENMPAREPSSETDYQVDYQADSAVPEGAASDVVFPTNVSNGQVLPQSVY